MKQQKLEELLANVHACLVTARQVGYETQDGYFYIQRAELLLKENLNENRP